MTVRSTVNRRLGLSPNATLTTGQLSFCYFPSGHPRDNAAVPDNAVLDYFQAQIKSVKSF